MSILEYFKRTSTSGIQPNGSLSAIVPSTAIVAANIEVQQLAEKRLSRKRGPYNNYTPKNERLLVNMLSNVELLLLRKCFLESRGKLSTEVVRGFKKVYKKKKREAGDDDACVTKLDTKKKGRPVVLGEKMDFMVQNCVPALKKD